MIEPIRETALYRGNVIFLTDRGAVWRFWMERDEPRWEKLASRADEFWLSNAQREIEKNPK